jgi:hypothetical protein
MPLQTAVNFDLPVGLPGMKAALEPTVYAGNLVSEGPVTVGNFVWYGTTINQVKATGAGQPLGIVERNISFPDFDLKDEGTLVIADAWEVTVAIKGRYWFKNASSTATAATVGQKVFVKPTDGTFLTGAAGTSTSGSDAFKNTVETAWVVKTAGAIGDIIIIENY